MRSGGDSPHCRDIERRGGCPHNARLIFGTFSVFRRGLSRRPTQKSIATARSGTSVPLA
jgi:hypothetical protein